MEHLFCEITQPNKELSTDEIIELEESPTLQESQITVAKLQRATDEVQSEILGVQNGKNALRYLNEIYRVRIMQEKFFLGEHGKYLPSDYCIQRAY